MGEHAQGRPRMFHEGFFNFLDFILSSSDQPQKFIVFVAAMLLINVVMAVIDWKWGRGIGFTILALLAGAFSVYVTVIFLQGMRRNLDLELTDPQSWASLGVYLDILYWYILELPVIFGLGVGAVVLAALSRQRRWIIGNAVALALTILAPLLAMWILPAINADTDIFNPLAVHDRDVRLFQAHLAFVVVLLAIQLLYLAYGIWRIWRSRGLGRQMHVATSLPSVQS
ncbi:MAG TPA: hypothetical protein VGF38_17980 [Ktedonobacterales bacterium]|jgi:hypothetical protein